MSKFRYIRPESLEEALVLIQELQYDNTPLAGGTDLLVTLRSPDQTYRRLVDISRLNELKIIRQNGNTVTLGAGVTFTEILGSEILRQTAPFLIIACNLIGGPQIRNQGTVGGNVVNAAVCAESLPVLVCLEANVHLKSLSSNRQIALADFVLGDHQNQIQPGELLTHFTFEVPSEGTRTAFLKLGRRNAQAVSRLSVATLGRLGPAGQVEMVRIVPGAVGQRTRRVFQAEELLQNEYPTPERIAASGCKVAEQIVADNGWRWSTEYKEPVIAKLTERALTHILMHRPGLFFGGLQ
jgi:CO/xanthine dehydrogenase FAD-binding subunit